jgi:hypothetical protein
VDKQAHNAELLKVTNKWVYVQEKLEPQCKVCNHDSSRCWYMSWNKRSCQHYATEHLLRFLAHGASPQEAAGEKAQGLGRKCMHRCLHLSSGSVLDPQGHQNRCGLRCFAVSKSSIMMSEEEMRADQARHKKAFFAEFQVCAGVRQQHSAQRS